MKHLTVIGAGTMGNGIAHVFAQYGFQVVLCDISQERLDLAMHTIEKNLSRQVAKDKITKENKTQTLQNILGVTDLSKAAAKSDLIIEAATEKEEIKLSIFRELDHYSPKDCILATNTSSISITKIAAVTNRPEKVIGMHFMNPVPIMQLVEVINGFKTSAVTTKTIMDLAKIINKTPIAVNDYPGFIANRILMPMINEAIYALYEGVAGVREIDDIMKLGMAHPMGPLQLADFIGLDVCHAILRVLYKGLGNPKYAPCPLLSNMVLSGNIGRKSKIGFYDYRHEGKDAVVAKNFIT